MSNLKYGLLVKASKDGIGSFIVMDDVCHDTIEGVIHEAAGFLKATPISRNYELMGAFVLDTDTGFTTTLFGKRELIDEAEDYAEYLGAA